MADPTRWWVIVPLKDTRTAKSRLGGPDEVRRRTAIAMAADTLTTVAATPCVEGVVVICDRLEDVEHFAAPGVSVVACPGLSLNEAIREGSAIIRATDRRRNIAALPGDLPYLTTTELDAALGVAAQYPSACVGDRSGRGTTLTTAVDGTDLTPSYGEGSLARHRCAGAIELGVSPFSGLRRDVDRPEDLTPADELGPETRRILGRHALQPVGRFW